MLILSDFDGTITEEDVTNLIWDRYGVPNWREVLLPPYYEGWITSVGLMMAGYRAVRVPERELAEFLRPRVRLRKGFSELVARCRERDWPFAVVSCGLDWYIRSHLPEGTPLCCLAAEYREFWDVRLPKGMDLRPGMDFKVHALEQLQARYPGLPVVFIGDGRNDLEVARRSDRVFARAGSNLVRFCTEARVPFTEFITFDEISALL